MYERTGMGSQNLRGATGGGGRKCEYFGVHVRNNMDGFQHQNRISYIMAHIKGS